MKRIQTALLIVCALLVATPASAQLNLNSLKNKAKNAVKQEVSKQKQKASATAINAVEGNDKAAEQTTNTKQNTATTTQAAEATEKAAEQEQQPEKLKPSAAAIAADPGASDQTVRQGYSKTTAEIRAGYEQLLDAEKFIYQPYYEGDNKYFYYVETPETDINKFHLNIYAWFLMKAQEEYGVGWKSINMFVGGIPGWGDRQVPYGEHTMHAGFAEVIADPGGSQPFNHFLRACSILEVSALCSVSNYASYSATSKEIKNGDQVVKLVEDDVTRMGRNRWLRELAEQAIHQSSPFELIEYMANAVYETFEKRQEKGQFVVFDAFEYKEAVSLLAGHRDLLWGDEARQAHCKAIVKKPQRQLEDVEAKKDEFYAKNIEEAERKALQMTKADIPQPGMTDATMEALFRRLAVAPLGGADVIKVIIRDAGWFYDKNELDITSARYKGTYVIYQYQGTTYMVDMTFKQPAIGGGKFGNWQFRGLGMYSRVITDW